MPRRVINLRSQVPLLDIVSYARGRGPLTRDQRAYIARTVRRVPEVVVKVSGGARTLAGVERHLQYIEKKGASGLETDMDTRAGGKGFARDLVRDWDLDVEALKHYSKKMFRGKPPRLVHNLIFSMPAGTSSKAVLGAVRKLALNEWALEHRYALALHTDTPRPHVHVALKAVSEQGIRLNIKKSDIRKWRTQFASNLRELGVAANATERAVRGETRISKRTEIFRAGQRGDSSHLRHRRLTALSEGVSSASESRARTVLNRTRQHVVDSFLALAVKFRDEGDIELAHDTQRFLDRMGPVKTEAEAYAAEWHRNHQSRDPWSHLR